MKSQTQMAKLKGKNAKGLLVVEVTDDTAHAKYYVLDGHGFNVPSYFTASFDQIEMEAQPLVLSQPAIKLNILAAYSDEKQALNYLR